MKKQQTECKTILVHEDTVREVQETLPEIEVLYDLAELFKIFADSTRIKILHALNISELCVCDLAEILAVSQSAVSHQLKTLRHSKLVKFRKEGKIVFYSIKDDHVKKILDMGLEHTLEKD